MPKKTNTDPHTSDDAIKDTDPMRSLFRSKQQADVETLRAKIAEAEQTLADAEADLAAKALEAALSPDPHPAAGPLQKVHEAKDRLEVLRHALNAAIAEEDRRQREKRAELWQSQLRAARQQIGIVIKEAKAAEVHLSNFYSAFYRALDAGKSIDATMTGKTDSFRAVLGYMKLRAAFELEMARQGAELPSGGGRDAGAPGSSNHPSFGWWPSKQPTLAEELERRLLAIFDQVSGKTSERVPEPAPTTTAEDIPAAIRAFDPFLKREPPATEEAA